MPPDTKYTAFNHPHPHYTSSHISFETDDSLQHNNASPSPQKGTAHKSLLLLSRSQGVQTDDWPGPLAPPLVPPSFGEQLSYASPPDGQSESSSLLDSNSSHIGIVLDRISMLLTRITQADALTLTNRLKRQNLKGADLGHLSHTTVASILNEATQLRAQFRAILEDDKVPVTCTRRDLRGLFKLFREFFSEMGQMRITLNDVILDPSIAWKVSEMALDPAKAAERERQAAKGSSWMTPLAKLFGGPIATTDPTPATGDGTSLARAKSRGRDRTPARKAPKLGPALAATTTTVNVEFSGAGVGRSLTNTSTVSVAPTRRNGRAAAAPPLPQTQASFMNIFAGAPRPLDPWVVLPKDPRRGPSTKLTSETFGTMGRPSERMSQNINAVIDSRDPHGQTGEDGTVLPPFQRTLRRRGLSDSSIHSSFMTPEVPPSLPGPNETSAVDGWPDRAGVLRTFSRKVQQGFRSAAPGAMSSDTAGSTSVSITPATSPSQPMDITRVPNKKTAMASSLHLPQASSPISTMLPSMNSWTTAAAALEPGEHDQGSLLIRSPRDDFIHRPWGREAQGRDF